ncbi:MAG: hypothetical protein ABI430_01010 [Candidatus Taylorbacteria bacterium]
MKTYARFLALSAIVLAFTFIVANPIHAQGVTPTASQISTKFKTGDRVKINSNVSVELTNGNTAKKDFVGTIRPNVPALSNSLGTWSWAVDFDYAGTGWVEERYLDKVTSTATGGVQGGQTATQVTPKAPEFIVLEAFAASTKTAYRGEQMYILLGALSTVKTSSVRVVYPTNTVTLSNLSTTRIFSGTIGGSIGNGQVDFTSVPATPFTVSANAVVGSSIQVSYSIDGEKTWSPPSTLKIVSPNLSSMRLYQTSHKVVRDYQYAVRTCPSETNTSSCTLSKVYIQNFSPTAPYNVWPRDAIIIDPSIARYYVNITGKNYTKTLTIDNQSTSAQWFLSIDLPNDMVGSTNGTKYQVKISSDGVRFSGSTDVIVYNGQQSGVSPSTAPFVGASRASFISTGSGAGTVSTFSPNLIIKRVDADLNPISGTQATVDSISSVGAANPYTVSLGSGTGAGQFNPSVGQHTAYATDLFGYDEYSASCTFAGGGLNNQGTECLIGSQSSYSKTNVTCSLGFCSVPVNITAGQVSKVVFRYVPTTVTPVTPSNPPVTPVPANPPATTNPPPTTTLPPVTTNPAAGTPTVLPWNAPSTIQAGQTLNYTLNWSGGPYRLSLAKQNWSVFVFLRNKADRSKEVNFGFFPNPPTAQWPAGTMSTPSSKSTSDIPPGSYDVLVGMYVGSERLVFAPGSGVSDAGSSRYKVGEITVTAAPNTTNAPAPSITDFRTSQPITNDVRSTTLVWSATNATGCTLNGPNFSNASYRASEAINTGVLTSNANYTLTCRNSAGASVSRDLAVSVPAIQQVQTQPTVLPWNAPSSIQVGQTLNYTLNWSGGPYRLSLGKQSWSVFVFLNNKVDRSKVVSFGFFPNPPTDQWSAGTMSTPSSKSIDDIPVGSYDVLVGMYVGSERLVFTPGSGVSDAGNSRYKVGEITITAAPTTQSTSYWAGVAGAFLGWLKYVGIIR